MHKFLITPFFALLFQYNSYSQIINIFSEPKRNMIAVDASYLVNIAIDSRTSERHWALAYYFLHSTKDRFKLEVGLSGSTYSSRNHYDVFTDTTIVTSFTNNSSVRPRIQLGYQRFIGGSERICSFFAGINLLAGYYTKDQQYFNSRGISFDDTFLTPFPVGSGLIIRETSYNPEDVIAPNSSNSSFVETGAVLNLGIEFRLSERFRLMVQANPEWNITSSRTEVVDQSSLETTTFKSSYNNFELDFLRIWLGYTF